MPFLANVAAAALLAIAAAAWLLTLGSVDTRTPHPLMTHRILEPW
jgi:hypothetical protein